MPHGPELHRHLPRSLHLQIDHLQTNRNNKYQQKSNPSASGCADNEGGCPPTQCPVTATLCAQMANGVVSNDCHTALTASPLPPLAPSANRPSKTKCVCVTSDAASSTRRTHVPRIDSAGAVTVSCRPARLVQNLICSQCHRNCCPCLHSTMLSYKSCSNSRTSASG